MADETVILVCTNFEREVAAACGALHDQSIIVHSFPATCEQPPIDWKSVASQFGGVQPHCVHLIGGPACARAAAASGDLTGCRIHQCSQCFDLFLNSSIVDHYVKSGAYLLTPGWLIDWREHLNEWGFDQERASKSFGDFASKLVLLDTGVDEASQQRIVEMAEFTGLPFEVVPVGLDHVNLLVANTVREQQLEQRHDSAAPALPPVNFSPYDEIKRVEASLAAERQRLAVTLQSIGDGVIATDVNGNVALMNGVSATLTGWSSEEALGKPLREVFNIVHGESGEASADPVEQVLRTGGLVELANDTVLIAKDGTRRDIADTAAPILDDEGSVLGVVLVFRDVTKWKKTEENLRKMQRAVEQNPCSIVITDLHGAIEYVNPKFVRLTGYTPEEAMGQNPRILKSGEKPSEEYKAMWETITAGEEWRGEFHNKKKNGEFYWESASISPIRNANGIVTHFIAVKEDVTERKRIEEDRERLVRELEQRAAELNVANKELEAFSYSVSHDLRAPLRAVDGFSLALLEDYADALDEQGKRYLQLVRESSQRMAQLIDDLLGLSRVARSEMRRGLVDLSGLASGVAAELKSTQPERMAEFAIATGLQARGDMRLLRIVLENLLGNAWKFTSKRLQTIIEFGATEMDGETVYYVRDNGAGFDMAYADKLFGAFQRLHSAGEFPGTGIGLATVQRIIHRHGGRVWAEGAIGQGATIYFTVR